MGAVLSSSLQSSMETSSPNSNKTWREISKSTFYTSDNCFLDSNNSFVCKLTSLRASDNKWHPCFRFSYNWFSHTYSTLRIIWLNIMHFLEMKRRNLWHDFRNLEMRKKGIWRVLTASCLFLSFSEGWLTYNKHHGHSLLLRITISFTLSNCSHHARVLRSNKVEKNFRFEILL